MENQNKPPKTELAPNWDYRRRCFANLLRMGHCAPTVMQTILDISSTEKEWLVKLSAGMPGGIGNTGFECGAESPEEIALSILSEIQAFVNGRSGGFLRNSSGPIHLITP